VSIETHVLDVIREQLSRRQPVDGGSRNVVRTMTSTCGYAEVRSLAAQRLEMWLQNPKVYPVMRDVDIVLLSLTGLSLSILTAIFPGGPGLAGTRMSPFWILLELRVMEVVVTTGVTRCVKLKMDCYHQQTTDCYHEQTNTQLFTGRMAFLSPPTNVKALKGKL